MIVARVSIDLNCSEPVNKLSELNKRINIETAAHCCSVAALKKSEAALSRCSSK